MSIVAPESRTRRYVARSAIAVFAIVMVVFWTWALFIADPDPVNRIGDQEWTARADARCETASAEMDDLANFTVVEPGNTDQIQQRASIVERANDILESMLDDLAATPPQDAKGQVLIPAWLADYRIFLNDRREYVELLRSSGENHAFSESITDQGIPISELLETFAGDNRMPHCAPKRDLT